MDFVDTFVGKCNGVQARRGGRGRGEPTIIYIKEIIRFKQAKASFFRFSGPRRRENIGSIVFQI